MNLQSYILATVGSKAQRGEAVDIEKCKGNAEDAGMFWNLGSME